ncbi:MAG TPA: mechanosensitive ion channel protein MscS [Desulfobacteraceae bacterium]|nr:mechanosensitive ion channel protein MscS [Desulfobacteraceae bacterium]|tara:strand:+ start:1394 stop:2329 length:936 start_codon:yes stop_codon:yes gene_type:complete
MPIIYQDILSEIPWESFIISGLRIALVLLFTWSAAAIIKKMLARLEKRLVKQGVLEGEPPSESQKRVETIVRLIRQAMLLAVWSAAVLVVLKQLGVQVAPFIASVGVVGLAVGFGAQNLVRDVISGFFIILENQIRVGDVAIINGTGGLVEKINFRTTVLRDLSGTVHVFPNGTVSTLSNLTNEWSAYVFDLSVSLKEDIDRVMEIIAGVGDDMLSDQKFGRLMLEKIEIFGVDRFDDSSVKVKGRIKTKPIRQWEVGREFLRRVKSAFDSQGIEIPFPHRTLYFGGSDKTDIRGLQKTGEKKQSKTTKRE